MNPNQHAPLPALLLIDLQVDFLDASGRLPVAADQVPGLLAEVSALATRARALGWPVAHVVNAFPPGSWLNVFRRHAAIAGSPGAALDPRAPAAAPDEPTFYKAKGDAFTRPELAAWLRERGVTRVVLAGVFADGCVRATARGALAAGFDVVVPPGAVAARSVRARARGLAAIARAGGQVVPALDISDRAEVAA